MRLLMPFSFTSSLFQTQLILSLLCNLYFASALPGLNIDNGPAPSPEDGPPLSRHASRNKALLPYQITGIVGAYVIVTVTALTLLLTLGKRLRRQALAGTTFYRIEMVKTHPNGTALGVQDTVPLSPTQPQQWESPVDSEASYQYPSPISPTTGEPRSWVKPSGASHRTQSSLNGSDHGFDGRVIDHDRARAQSEMEKLYAAVAVHEEEKERRQTTTTARTISVRTSPRPDRQSTLPSSPRPSQTALPSSPRPSQTAYAHSMASSTGGLASPTSPSFAAAGQPYGLASPAQSTFSQNMQSPRQTQFASPLASPTSFTQYAYQPPMSPNALSHPMAPTPVPNPLSPPLSPRDVNSSRLSKANPLSLFAKRNSSGEKQSRISFKGLPISNPLVSPKLKNSIGVVREEIPMSPSLFNPNIPSNAPTSHQKSLHEITVMPTIPQSAEPTPLPQHTPSTISSKRTAPAPLTLGRNNREMPSIDSQTAQQKSLGELPLRSFGPTPPQSAPFTRVQFADRRESKLNPGPKTGVPYPHSPYMPFSPVTPLSATLKTGKELKLAKKMAKLEEREMVQSEDEIWGE